LTGRCRGFSGWLLARPISRVGLLLGFGLISQYALSKNEEAMKRGEQIRGKLAPFQAMLGVAQIVMSVLYFVMLM
jgi:hypothetical protein